MSSMDRLKLAQFNKISNSSTNQGYQFLKNYNINVNSSITNEPYQGLQESAYAGYTYLHFAAKNFDLPSIIELLRRNADLVSQSINDRNTPLHIVSGHLKTKKSHCDEKIMNYAGKLKENKFVETLLSAQVETGNASNPKSNDGTSHLHVACMYNHFGAVELFLNAGELVDHATNDKHPLPGYTALHFAVRFSAFEAAEFLLKHGADMHLKDSAGKSALHCMIERLMDIADFLATGKRTYYPFYKTERDILESMLKIFLGSMKADTVDDIGLMFLHIVCTLKDSPALKIFLTQSVDINVATNSESKLWPGWTPLHFAACFSIKTFKLLLLHGADLNIKNTKGETPLDLCMQRYSPHIVQSILSTKDEFKAIVFTDGTTNLLETLLLMSNDDLFKEWLDDTDNLNISIPLDSPIWPGYNLLHLAVLNERMKLKDKKMIFEAGLSSDVSHIENELSNYWERIMSLLTKYGSFNSKNADGLLPLYLAFKICKITSVDKILNVLEENEEDSSGLSFLHIACVTGNMKAIEMLANKENLNHPVKGDIEWYTKDSNTEIVHIPANSTPLHIAVITNKAELVNNLLKNDANMHLRDHRGFSPLHLSLMNDENLKITKLFLAKLIDSEEFETKDNLSCLHIAAIYDDGKAIEKLLQKNVNSEVPFDPTNPELRSKFSNLISKTPLHIALLLRNSQAVEALMKGGVDLFSTSVKDSEKLLNLAIHNNYHRHEYFYSKLKQNKLYSIKPIDDSGLTMLYVASDKHAVKWIQALLKKGADPNARVASNDEKFWNKRTCFEAFVFNIRHGVITDEGVIKTLQLFVEHGADVTTRDKRGNTPILTLYNSANDSFSYYREKKYAESMMSAIGILFRGQTTYDVNPTNAYGLSHFHVACSGNYLDIAYEFLDCGVDVNAACDPFTSEERFAGYTPLHFALERESSNVARLLIERGANVNAEDLRGDTPLHIALKQGFVDEDLIELMWRHGGDINAKNVNGHTPIEYLIAREAFTLLQFITMMNQGAVIDLISIKSKGSGFIGLAMLNVEPNNRSKIFKIMTDSCDMKDVIKRGGNIIDSAVNVDQKGQLTVDFYLSVIEQLVDAGCDLDQQDSEGKTALHRATSLYNHEAVKALLLVGANLNAIDKNGESPFTKQVINDKHSGRRSITLNLLASQVWKMRNMGVRVNESTKSAAFLVINQLTASGNLANFHLMRKPCLRELRKARTTFILKLSLANFLSESNAVIQYARMPASEREAVDAYFNCRENMRLGFTESAGFLMMQYRKAVARTKMLGPAMQVIFEAGIKLPTLCLAEIVQHLNYDELKLLVEES